MPSNPLAEVFGYPTDDASDEAERHRHNKLCPFNNSVPNCTKVRAANPLGVCSVFHDALPVVTCPVRFRQDWVITNDAAKFFFPRGTSWTSLVEVRIDDRVGRPAGKFDVVLVSYDERGMVTDFGALEVQAVYISGNVQAPFDRFMASTATPMTWPGPNYPRPDYLSSSRKRLAPQLMFKGGIVNTWGKKQAVALQTAFYNTLPALPRLANEGEADMVWLLYDLALSEDGRFRLQLHDTIFTQFGGTIDTLMRAKVGRLDQFVATLQHQLDAKLVSPQTVSLGQVTEEELDPDNV